MNSPATVNLPQLSLHLEEQRRIFVSCNINHSISGPGGSPVQVSLWVPYPPHSSPPRLDPQALPDSASHTHLPSKSQVPVANRIPTGINYSIRSHAPKTHYTTQLLHLV